MSKQELKLAQIQAEEPSIDPGKDAFLIGYRGSIAHGMHIPNSDPDSIDDKDIMGVCIPAIDEYFGTARFGHKGNGTREIARDPWDIVIYEFRKFIGLLKNGNPNVLSLLWLEPEHYIYRSPEADLLIEFRDLFLAKSVKASFVGYAHGQLHRMTHQQFEGYMGSKRKALVEKHGYDTKNAAHLIRLLRMGIEALTEGVLHVRRSDNNQLLDIKRGEWTLEQVKAEASRLFALVDEAYVRSILSPEPDHVRINALSIEILRRTFIRRGHGWMDNTATKSPVVFLS